MMKQVTVVTFTLAFVAATYGYVFAHGAEHKKLMGTVGKMLARRCQGVSVCDPRL